MTNEEMIIIIESNKGGHITAKIFREASEKVHLAGICKYKNAFRFLDNPTEKEKALYNIKWEL